MSARLLPFVPSIAPRVADSDTRRGRVLVMDLRHDRLLQSIVTQAYALPDPPRTETGASPEPESAVVHPGPPTSLTEPLREEDILWSDATAQPRNQRPARWFLSRCWNDIGVRPAVTVCSIVMSGLTPFGVAAVPLKDDGYDLLAAVVVCAAVVCGAVAVRLWTILLRRTDSPQAEPDEDDSEWAALHYRRS